jgi:energy-converting hydrogenase Eha subunit E
MRMHFFSRLALLLVAGFLVVASQVWTDDTLQWLFVAGGAVMIIGAAIDAGRADPSQRALDGIIGLLGAWTVFEAFAFEGTNLEWWTFASGCALAALSTIGLVMHEMRTERVVHEFSVTKPAEREPSTA